MNTDAGVQWLFSFLSADKKKTYCLYEAPNAEAIREAARRLNIPADVIIEVESGSLIFAVEDSICSGVSRQVWQIIDNLRDPKRCAGRDGPG